MTRYTISTSELISNVTINTKGTGISLEKTVLPVTLVNYLNAYVTDVLRRTNNREYKNAMRKVHRDEKGYKPADLYSKNEMNTAGAVDGEARQFWMTGGARGWFEHFGLEWNDDGKFERRFDLAIAKVEFSNSASKIRKNGLISTDMKYASFVALVVATLSSDKAKNVYKLPDIHDVLGNDDYVSKTRVVKEERYSILAW